MNNTVLLHGFKKYLLSLLGTCLVTSTSSAASLTEAKLSLSQVSQRISLIKNNIAQNVEQHHSLKQKIDNSQNLIEQNFREQAKIKQQIEQASQQIQNLQQNIQQNEKQLIANRKAIYQHLKLALRLSREPYWQILFGAQNPFEYYQQLELHEYLYSSEQQHLELLKTTEKKLAQQQVELRQNQQHLVLLQQQLADKRQLLMKQKITHQEALKLVSEKINEKTSQLHQAEKDQDNLKRLIQTLLKNNTLQSHKPFSVMRRKLAFPLNQNQGKTQKVQNGLLFLANTGTDVHAVSPGKVVFADWLNGYGYLTIVDHGWGFMTLYGNNQSLTKHKGELVKQGDVIAKVGNSGTFHQTGLYFEIRQRAHVVAASSWFKEKIS